MANNQAAPIVSQIRQNDAEILILQEYTSLWHTALQSTFGDDYPYCRVLQREDSFGSAVYSRRPFDGVPRLGLVLSDGWQPMIRAVIQIDGREVAVYDVHLLPPRRYDYTVAWRRHFADVLGLLAEEALPVILAGDFNFTDNSTFADDLRQAGFSSAYSIAGRGRGWTWPALDSLWWFPRVRLDHVFLRGGLTCSHAQTGEPFGSDHLPLIITIGFGTS
jgi:vancomycin resistance protein VanJ